MSGGAGTSILPPVVVLPIACVAVLVISAHLAAIAATPDMPLSRRRIRTAAGVVMLITSLILAYAFAYTGPADPRRFAIAWTASVMLLTMVLALGGLDAINNARLARAQRRRIRRAAHDLQRRIAEAVGAARAGSHGGAHDGEPRLTLRGGGDPET